MMIGFGTGLWKAEKERIFEMAAWARECGGVGVGVWRHGLRSVVVMDFLQK